jgi:UDP-N-acetyl-2-amino-2-deoxyglucuronate dehydrogenase
MDQEIGFAIIGGGMIGQIHAEEIRKIKGAHLVAVAGPSKETAGNLALKYNAHWYKDYFTMLKREDIHIVNICTPSGMHSEMAIAAARAGKHIIVEKPMDVSLEKADLMIAEAKKFGVKLSVISQHRFDPSTIDVKKAIQSGKLGEIVLAEVAVNWYRTQEYYDSVSWRGTWKLDGGGALINQSIHTIDLLLHFLGPAKSVKALMNTAAHDKIEVEDVLVAAVEFNNNALCTIACTTAAYPGFSNRIELFGTNGSAIIESDQLIKCCFKDEKENEISIKNSLKPILSNPTGASNPGSISGHPHYLQFVDIIEAIRDNREPLINGTESRKTLEFVLAMYQSAREGKVVYL